jgi:tetratricopeptide (TPR) repeat protein
MSTLRSRFYASLAVVVLFVMTLGFFISVNLMNSGRLLLANNAYLAGDYGEAELKYKSVRVNELDKVMLAYNSGNTYYQQGRYLEAERSYRAAVALGKDNSIEAKLFYNLGLTYFRINDLPKSVAAFKKALLLRPAHKLTRLNLIYVAQQLDALKEKQGEDNDSGSGEMDLSKNGAQEGGDEKEESVDTSNETESMLDLVLKEEQSRKARAGKIKRKLNNLSKEENDY